MVYYTQQQRRIQLSDYIGLVDYRGDSVVSVCVLTITGIPRLYVCVWMISVCILGIWYCLLRLNPSLISQLVVSSFSRAAAVSTEVAAITMTTARKIQTLFAYYVQISTKISYLWNKKLSAYGGLRPQTRGYALGPSPRPRYLPPKLAVFPPKLGVCRWLRTHVTSKSSSHTHTQRERERERG